MKNLFNAFALSLLMLSCGQGQEDKAISENGNTENNNSQLSETIGIWEGPTSNSPGSPSYFYLDVQQAKKGVIDAQYWIQNLGDQNPTKQNITGSYTIKGDTISVVFDYSYLANEDNFIFMGSIINGGNAMTCSFESEPNFIYWSFDIWKNKNSAIN